MRIVLAQPPSVELAPDQVDTNRLAPYDILYRVLVEYPERQASATSTAGRLVADAMAASAAQATVLRVLR